MAETTTYMDFEKEILHHFAQVVEGVHGTYASLCGDLTFRREGDTVYVSLAAAKLMVRQFQQKRKTRTGTASTRQLLS